MSESGAAVPRACDPTRAIPEICGWLVAHSTILFKRLDTELSIPSLYNGAMLHHAAERSSSAAETVPNEGLALATIPEHKIMIAD